MLKAAAEHFTTCWSCSRAPDRCRATIQNFEARAHLISKHPLLLWLQSLCSSHTDWCRHQEIRLSMNFMSPLLSLCAIWCQAITSAEFNPTLSEAFWWFFLFFSSIWVHILIAFGNICYRVWGKWVQVTNYMGFSFRKDLKALSGERDDSHKVECNKSIKQSLQNSSY